MSNIKNNDIGKKLKTLRISLNLTQEELAQKLSIKRETIHKYENGIIKNIKYETIEKLAKIFNVTPQFLLGLSEKEIVIPSVEDLKNSIELFYQNKEISDESKDKFFKDIQELYFKERLKK